MFPTFCVQVQAIVWSLEDFTKETRNGEGMLLKSKRKKINMEKWF